MTFKPYYEPDTKDPTGWISPADVDISYNKTARTITLTGTLDYYWQGTKRTLSSPWTSDPHDSADGRYFLYTTDGVTFAWSTDVWLFFHAMVAIARKNTSPAYQFALREAHGLMPWQVHSELHELLSAYRVSGGGLTAGTYTENTASDAATTPGFDALLMTDEDVSTTIAAWAQGTYSTMRIGAGNAATFDTAASFPFRSSGSYILVNNTATGAEVAAGNNQYVNVYTLRFPVTDDSDSQAYRLVCLQPQRAFSSLASAQAEDTRSLSLGDLTPSIPEFVFYERITYVLASGDANTGKCRIATGGISYIFGSRMSQIAAPGFVTQTAENVPFTPAGSIAATNVQAAIVELDAEKQPLDSDLTAIAGLSPADNDIIQRKTGAWVNRTIAQLITDLTSGLSALFAPLANGVTNGDSHDHSGGDGAQIAYSGLSGLPTITNPPATTAAWDIQVGNGSGSWIKKTWAEFLANFPIAAGTWTPTLTNVTNLTASALSADGLYVRILNICIGSFAFSADPAAAGTWNLGFTLPVASAFTGAADLNGNATAVGASFQSAASVVSDATNDRGEVTTYSADGANRFWRVVFMYRIM